MMFSQIRFAFALCMFFASQHHTIHQTAAWIPTNQQFFVKCVMRNQYQLRSTSFDDNVDTLVEQKDNDRSSNVASFSPTISTKSRRDFMIESTISAASTVSTLSSFSSVSNAQIVDKTITTSYPTLSTSSASLPSAITLPKMGLGAWAWGDSLFWGYDKKNDDDLRKVFDYSVQNNPVTLLDTAEVYGLGRSESLIGEFAKSYPPEKIQVATKFAPLPWRTKPMDVVNACKKSLQRLDGRPIDLYQIHWPGAYSNEEYWDGIAMSYEMGYIKAVGVSNYGADAVSACYDALAKRGIPLTSNQIQLSLLYPHPLYNGLMDKCNELNVKVLSYSPLALGMLTGKYTTEKKPSGPRKAIYDKLMTTPDYTNLLSVMENIAKVHSTNGRTATIAQVALNWTRAKGSIPIPGARTLSQVQGNYDALNWDLSNDEVILLDTAASKVTTFIQPNQGFFPKKDKNTGLIMFDS